MNRREFCKILSAFAVATTASIGWLKRMAAESNVAKNLNYARLLCNSRS